MPLTWFSPTREGCPLSQKPLLLENNLFMDMKYIVGRGYVPDLFPLKFLLFC